MKALRICLLIVLALLLPVRGAVAATMLCPPMGTSEHMGGDEHAQHHHGSMAMPAADVAGDAQHQQHQQHHEDAGSAEKCNLCCAFCTMTPLPAHLLAVPSPIDVSAVAFADYAAPAPSFFSDGQERPPRST